MEADMDNAPHGTIYRKNGYYYARIYYYADGRRKSKDRATGIAIESSSARKAKQQERRYPAPGHSHKKVKKQKGRTSI